MATSLLMWQVAVFLSDIKERLEVSVAEKHSSVRNKEFSGGACYFSSHHSVKPSESEDS